MPFPNKDAQWKPGQSGNPAGLPKGTKHISTWIQELMNDEQFERLVPDKVEGWRTEKGAPVKAIVKTAMLRAEQGDQKWADWLAKYGWRQQLDITTNGKDLPTPILGGVSVNNGLLGNNSNAQATEAPQED